jgi:hypothetical protein
LQHSLLRRGFVPIRPSRELRGLTWGSTQLARERARMLNRLQKVLQDANVKLGWRGYRCGRDLGLCWRS